MSQETSKSLKIFFNSVDGIGHLNACVGLAQALTKRGHRVYFLVNDAFAGGYAKYGFDEILLYQGKNNNKQPADQQKDAEPSKEKRNPVKEMAEHLVKSGFLSPRSPIEKMRDQMAKNEPDQIMETFFAQAVEYNPQIAAAIEKEQPDLFIVDNFMIPPAVRMAKLPWIYSFSANPNFLYRSDKLPPFGSGKLTYRRQGRAVRCCFRQSCQTMGRVNHGEIPANWCIDNCRGRCQSITNI